MDTQIAGKKTIANWQALRPKLVGNRDPDLWAKVYKDYFVARLRTRYIRPIELLQKHDTLQGEGFAISSIQCALIEFLAATVIGKSYRFIRRGQSLGQFEYNKSAELFKDFLSQQQPFKTYFSPEAAEDFYKSIRCGILHEAATKNGWRIHAGHARGTVIDRTNKILYRNGLQNLLKHFTKEYGRRLQMERALQEAFIRKYDKLAEG